MTSRVDIKPPGVMTSSDEPVSCGSRWRSPKTARIRDVRLPNVPSQPRHSTIIVVYLPSDAWKASPPCPGATDTWKASPPGPGTPDVSWRAADTARADLPTPWQPQTVTRRRAPALPGTPLPSNRVSCCSSASRPISGLVVASSEMFDTSSGMWSAARNQIEKKLG